MICVDVRSGSWLNIPLKLCLLPSSCTVRTDGGLPKPRRAWCVVDVTAASCCLGGSRRLLIGCWQYPNALGICGNSG